MCPESLQDSVTPTNIREVARFDTPGETWGWTGEGEIEFDAVAEKYCWFSIDAQRDFGQKLAPSAGVHVRIRLRGLLENETLIATHSAGVREIKGLPNKQFNLYLIEGAKADANGRFFVQFKLATKNPMSIESIEVIAPI